MKDKEKKMILGIGIVFLFLATVGFSYAYFSSTITNKDVKNQVVETGTLELTYTDGPEIVMNNVKPGATLTKEVSVKNTGTLEASYEIFWQELNNGITNDEMIMSATCERKNSSGTVEGTCEGVDSAAISNTSIKKNITIESGVTHKYTFTITFKEANKTQNYNQGKKFSGVLGIKEFKIPEPVSFETDSWETIIEAVRNDNTDKYSLGDTKYIKGFGTVRIVNKSTPDVCSTEGFSQTACGFVLETTGYAGVTSMNYSGAIQPGNENGYDGSQIRSLVNNLYYSLPEELKNGVLDTRVVSGHGSGELETYNYVNYDKLYVLSAEEVYSSDMSDSDTAAGTSRTLDYYYNECKDTDRTCSAFSKGESDEMYESWFRSPLKNDSTMYTGAWKGTFAQLLPTYEGAGYSATFRIG